jgi:hypothetical protein
MIVARDTQGFIGDELARFTAALDMANAVLLRDDFADAIRRHTKRDGTAGFDDTKDTAEQVIEALRIRNAQGIDLHFHIVNQTIKMWFNHTVAEEAGDVVTFNRAKYGQETLPALTNTIVHEAMHAIGYRHDHKALYPWTVPYGVGSIAEKIAVSILGEGLDAAPAFG